MAAAPGALVRASKFTWKGSLLVLSIGAAGRSLPHGSPRVRWLGRLNFFERVLVCVFFVFLLLLFSGYLLVAFFSELATTPATTKNTNTTTAATTTIAGSHLRVCGHRQYRDYRSYRKGSHFPPSKTELENQHGRRD
jgi:hypothetical protein